MQSRDENGNIKQLTPVDLSELNDLTEKIKTAEEKGAVSHTIAKLPKEGESVDIHGLAYRVEFADFVKGKFTLKLVCRDQ